MDGKWLELVIQLNEKGRKREREENWNGSSRVRREEEREVVQEFWEFNLLIESHMREENEQFAFPLRIHGERRKLEGIWWLTLFLLIIAKREKVVQKLEERKWETERGEEEEDHWSVRKGESQSGEERRTERKCPDGIWCLTDDHEGGKRARERERENNRTEEMRFGLSLSLSL